MSTTDDDEGGLPSDREAAEFERRLIRSARLDVPRPGAPDRVLAQVLDRQARESMQRRWVVAGGVALAVAAGTIVWILQRGARAPQHLDLRPEPALSDTARVPDSTPPAPARQPLVPSLPPCPKLVVARGDSPLIDDFEDRNARLALADGRSGQWNVFNDGTGKQTPQNRVLHPTLIPGGREQSRYALHTLGGVFSQWGASFTGSFIDGGVCYDASAYAGLEFWAKGNTRISVSTPTIDTMPVDNGGVCTDGCYSGPDKAIDLTPHWQRYTLRWAELVELSRELPHPFDPRRVLFFGVNIAAEDTPFDIWVDDVRFLER